MNQPIIWTPGITLAAIEKQVILNAFRFYRGHYATCAVALGIAEKTLRTKLKEYEDDDQRIKAAQDEERAERNRQLIRSRGLVGTNASPTEGVILGSGAGVHVEPATQASPQHAVPVSEPEKVQSVLPSKVAAGRESRRR